jgi:hypothetical protein
VSPRVRRILKLVDELELEPAEVRALRVELGAREECEIDLDACANEDERQLALAIKQRIDAAARGEAKLVPISDVMKRAREGLRTIQAERRGRSR